MNQTAGDRSRSNLDGICLFPCLQSLVHEDLRALRPNAPALKQGRSTHSGHSKFSKAASPVAGGSSWAREAFNETLRQDLGCCHRRHAQVLIPCESGSSPSDSGQRGSLKRYFGRRVCFPRLLNNATTVCRHLYSHPVLCNRPSSKQTAARVACLQQKRD